MNVLKSKILVTGGCGFMGSHLVDRLATLGHDIIVIDDLSSGSLKNIYQHYNKSYFTFIEADLRKNDEKWIRMFKGVDAVFHFAANPEVRLSVAEPQVHFERNLIATFNVLETSRRHDVRYFVFASSSTVYGDAETIPTPEDHPLKPISVYGACKAASENLIFAYTKLYGIRSISLRYANIIGSRNNHGIIIDFINKLRTKPHELEILGDGEQKKSYLYVKDAIDATLHLFNKLTESNKIYDVYNVGNEDWITVKEIADIVTEEMGLWNVKYVFRPITEDGRGWPGDVKFMLLDITKLKSSGWAPMFNSKQAVRQATRDLVQQGNKS